MKAGKFLCESKSATWSCWGWLLPLAFSPYLTYPMNSQYQNSIPLLIAFMAQYSSIRRLFPQILQLITILFLNFSHDTLSLRMIKSWTSKQTLNLLKNLKQASRTLPTNFPHVLSMNLRIEVTSLLSKTWNSLSIVMETVMIKSPAKSGNYRSRLLHFYKTIVSGTFSFIKLIGFKIQT